MAHFFKLNISTEGQALSEFLITLPLVMIFFILTGKYFKSQVDKINCQRMVFLSGRRAIENQNNFYDLQSTVLILKDADGLFATKKCHDIEESIYFKTIESILNENNL